MSREEWELVYRLASQRYYTMDHIATVLRRVQAAYGRMGNAAFLMTWFKGSVDIENIHPLEGGFFRMKHRHDRRPCFPVESFWRFYSRYLSESAIKLTKWAVLYMRIRHIYYTIKRNPDRFRYSDMATSPIDEDEIDKREIFRSETARAYVSQERHLKKVREGSAIENLRVSQGIK
jgi:hypothetical protein